MELSRTRLRPSFGRLIYWRDLIGGLGPTLFPRRQYLIPVAVHALLIVLAAYFALWLRFDGALPPQIWSTFTTILPWILVIRGFMFVPFGLYGGMWEYTGVWDLQRILLAVVTSSVGLYVPLYLTFTPHELPRSTVVIDSLLLISFVGGVRLLRRIVGTTVSNSGRPVLIIGAGDAGEMIVREMRRGGMYTPVGFVDDNPLKIGRTIHGVTVLGTSRDLPRVIAQTKPLEVLVAIPSAQAVAVRAILRRLEPFKLPITTVPGLKELVNGQVGVKQIRPLAIEDLLARSPVTLNVAEVRQMVRGKRVLVTGAGGSIGSELCRHLADLEPSLLILLDRYENGLHAVVNELRNRASGLVLSPTIGDVTDAGRVEEVFATHAPELVFHAAAHKHVPLMEENPCEAVKNNVAGTLTLVQAARRHRVERFVLISTDKAVNPSSVMGATKRVAELILQANSTDTSTRFVTVRFGNVLGSNGSVIPQMVEQIRAGGPVTVTHPDIRRYFMVIPEAVELVLQAAVLASQRETFVLDMGEQLKIYDVAKHLIRLSGLVPDDDIQIKFIGLRPGEKLMEELAGDGEILEASGAQKIFRVQWPHPQDNGTIMEDVHELIGLARNARAQETIDQLVRLVPSFERRTTTQKASDRATPVAERARSRPSPLTALGPLPRTYSA